MNKQTKFDTLIFDFDGTLHDSKYVVIKTHQECVKKLNLHLTVDFFLSQFGKPLEEARASMQEILTEDQIDAFLDCYFTNLLDKAEQGDIKLFPNTLDIIKRLKEDGWKLAINTNAHTPFIKAYNDFFNLEQYFDEIRYSDENDHISKAQRIHEIQDILDSHGAIMIGDSRFDIQAAKDANVLSIGCTFGFGDEKELKDADYLISDITELPEVLSKIRK